MFASPEPNACNRLFVGGDSCQAIVQPACQTHRVQYLIEDKHVAGIACRLSRAAGGCYFCPAPVKITSGAGVRPGQVDAFRRESLTWYRQELGLGPLWSDLE